MKQEIEPTQPLKSTLLLKINIINYSICKIEKTSLLLNHITTDFINGIEFSCADNSKSDLIFLRKEFGVLLSPGIEVLITTFNLLRKYN